MTRPTTIADLYSWQRDPHTIITVQTTHLLDLPPRAVAAIGELLAAIDDAADPRVERKTERETVTVTVARSQDELDGALGLAQRMWDHRQDRYTSALVAPSSVTDSTVRSIIDRHAEEEGLEPIEWPATEDGDDE